MRSDEKGGYMFTLDPTVDDPAAYGDSAEVTDALSTAGGGTAAFDDEPYEDEWGRHYSAYSPVFDSNHKERFDEIRVGVTEIQEACNTLNSSIQSLAAISEENATSIDVTASAFTDITDVISQVSDRADLIKDQSNDLGNAVSKYNS